MVCSVKEALTYCIYYCNYYSSRRELLHTIEKIEKIRNKSAVKRLILSEKSQNNKNNYRMIINRS
jgi:hypothetical protein